MKKMILLVMLSLVSLGVGLSATISGVLGAEGLIPPVTDGEYLGTGFTAIDGIYSGTGGPSTGGEYPGTSLPAPEGGYLGSSLLVDDGDAGQAAPWLNWSNAAKAVGLGRVHTVISSEAAAIILNPADLSFQNKNYLSLMHTQFFDGVTLDYAGVSYHFRGLGLGVGYQNFLSSGMTQYDGEQDPIGYFDDQEQALNLAVSKEVKPGLALGGTFRLVRQQILDQSSLGYGLNLGAKWRFKENWTAGAVLHNLSGRVYWSTKDMEVLPITARLGVSHYWPQYDLTVLGECHYDPGDKPVHLGVEKGYRKNLRLRAGLDGLTPTLGIGLIMARLSVDYAFVLDQDFGKRQYLSLNWQY